jgi:predicted transcriptional regulator
VATARKDAEEAEQELSEAQSLVTRGTTQAQQLQNSQINLKLRIERGTQAQEDCTTQHSLCKTANDELQALPDTDVVPVNTAYEQVKTLFKQTTYYERQVRESSQYMKAVQKQLGDVIDLPKETTEETPDNNTEPQIDLGEAPVLPET